MTIRSVLPVSHPFTSVPGRPAEAQGCLRTVKTIREKVAEAGGENATPERAVRGRSGEIEKHVSTPLSQPSAEGRSVYVCFSAGERTTSNLLVFFTW